MSLHRTPAISLAVVLLVILVAACADGPTHPGEAPRPMALELPEPSAVAGTLYRLGDLSDLDLETGTWTAYVGDRESALLRSGDGSSRVVIPLFVEASSLRSAPPDVPVAIELRRDGAPVALSPEALTVHAPAEAPGATEALVDDLAAIASHLDAVFAGMVTEVGGEAEAYRQATLGAFADIVEGHEAYSLAARLAALSAREVRLLDATVEASGAREAVAELADGLDVHEPVGAARSASELPGTTLDDDDLAYLMQFSAFMQQYSSDFVSEVAGTLSGASGGFGLYLLAALGQDVPVVGEALGVINFAIGLADLVLNKLVVALLPTRIVSLELAVDETGLAVGERVTSQVRILASNAPPPLTMNDVVAQIVNAAAIAAPGGPTSTKEAVEELVVFFLDRVNALLSAYSDDYPDLELDWELLSVPTTHWNADVDNPRWLTLLSSAPDVLAPSGQEIEWEALGRGGASLSVIPSTSSDAMVKAAYVGGAFGDDVVPSNAVTVTVSGLVLEVEFPSTLDYGATTPLVARAGYVTAGETVWEDGIWIDLDIEGGSADLLGSMTDPSGTFESNVVPSDGSTEVSIRVRATDDIGGEVTRTVTATVARPVGVLTLRRSVVFANAADREGELTCVGMDDFAQLEGFGSWNRSVQATCDFAGVTMTASQDTDVGGPTDDGSGEVDAGIVISGTGRGSFSGPSGYSGPENHQVTASSSLYVGFEVLSPGARLTGTFTLSIPNRRARGWVAILDTTTRTEIAIWEDDSGGSVTIDIPLEEGHRYAVGAAAAYDGDRYSLETEGEATFEVELTVTGS